ncbi:clathrin adaptor, mu subunit [Ramicandelaber brevisporus]|nr:clathrin adaptor, mu subunit [Ramicandelaber brevisporus]
MDAIFICSTTKGTLELCQERVSSAGSRVVINQFVQQLKQSATGLTPWWTLSDHGGDTTTDSRVVSSVVHGELLYGAVVSRNVHPAVSIPVYLDSLATLLYEYFGNVSSTSSSSSSLSSTSSIVSGAPSALVPAGLGRAIPLDTLATFSRSMRERMSSTADPSLPASSSMTATASSYLTRLPAALRQTLADPNITITTPGGSAVSSSITPLLQPLQLPSALVSKRRYLTVHQLRDHLPAIYLLISETVHVSVTSGTGQPLCTSADSLRPLIKPPESWWNASGLSRVADTLTSGIVRASTTVSSAVSSITTTQQQSQQHSVQNVRLPPTAVTSTVIPSSSSRAQSRSSASLLGYSPAVDNPATAAAQFPSEMYPWRPVGISYPLEEIYFDLDEQIHMAIDARPQSSLTVDTDSANRHRLINVAVTGSIACTSRLSAMPDVKVELQNSAALTANADNISFHQCINSKQFWNSAATNPGNTVVTFVPPDGGPTTLLRYDLQLQPTKQLEMELPILVDVAVSTVKSDISLRKCAITCLPNTQPNAFGSDRTFENVSLVINLPAAWNVTSSNTIKATMGYSYHDESTHLLHWHIGNISPKQQPHKLTIEYTMNQYSRSDHHPLGLSANVSWKMAPLTKSEKDQSWSELRIGKVNVTGHDGQQQPTRGVKYTIQSGVYSFRF